jgi:putative hydrolase of the HAD superfamily
VRPDPRAIVFDLDDTLYPYRQFKQSGFNAVAAHLAREHDLDEARVAAHLRAAARGALRGRELQACLNVFGLPHLMLPDLLAVLRCHEPALTLPAATRGLLRRLRDDGWAIGINTNGAEVLQRRKVAALGLEPLVDTVVYAAGFGTGAGKPEPDSFLEAARRLGVPAGCTVFVGNDEQCDIEGALAAGMLPILCAAWASAPEGTRARAVTRRLNQIPSIAHALLEEASTRHAA